MTEHIPTLDTEEIRSFLNRRPWLRPHSGTMGDYPFEPNMFCTDDVWEALRDRSGIPVSIQRDLSLLIYGYRQAK